MSKRPAHIIHLVFCFLLGGVHLLGQQGYVTRVKQLGQNAGLVGRRSTAALQDSDGFMWIATVDALNRYDGFSFTPFSQKNSKLNYRELNGGKLFEDEQGYLWLRYHDNVEFLHHRTFEVLTFEERFGAVGFPPDAIKYVHPNQQGDVLIYLKNDTKYLYRQGQIKPLEFPGTNWPWIEKEVAVHYDFESRELSIYNFDGRLKHQQTIAATPFHIDEEGSIYAAQYDQGRHASDILVCEKDDCRVLCSFKVPEGYERNDRWRYILDKERNRFIVYNVLDHQFNTTIIDIESGVNYPSNLEGNEYYLGTDKNGVLWLGYKDGVALFEGFKHPFDYYKEVINARGIWADSKNLVVSSSHKKDYIYAIDDPQQATEFKIDHDVYLIAKDQKAFWGGNYDLFSRVDIQTQNILETVYFKKSNHGNIWAALKDSAGNWWFGQDGINGTSKLRFYNPTQHDSAAVFDQYNAFENLKDAFIIHFLEDGKLIWASSNKGLICIDQQKGVVGWYHKDAEKGYRLPFQEVYWLYKDAEGVYWAATNQSGLVKFTLNKSLNVQSFQSYTTDNGLSSDVIYALFEDASERLWMSTQSGLTCLDKKTGAVRIFTDNQGQLPVNEFNRISGFQAADGRLYFGAVQGAIGFHPNEIDTASYDKKLLLSSVEFFVGKQEARRDETLTVLENNKLVVQPNVRFAKIEVALADYFDAEGARYFYKIEGRHDAFRPMDGNSIQLSNLPYGKYRLRFRGQARDKRFSTSEINLSLVVVRPFYLRWWFVLLVAAAIIGLFWLFYNWRVAQLKKRQVELEKVVKQRTEKIRQDKILIEQQAEELKALDKLKDRFFANISHELRTPLTMIAGPLSSLLKNKSDLSDKQLRYLHVIKRHTNYLKNRINEIMELNRLEVNKGQIDLQPIKLYDFLKVSIGNFESIAPEKQIILSFDYQMKKTAQILADKDKLEHIIYNYLSNAFKYTPKGGRVKVAVKEVENKIRLEVEDTGKGIPKEDIPNLFERFFQAKNAQKVGSSGIGLALCREIAELLNGRVWVESQLGKGSTFFFEMPYEEFIGIVESGPSENIPEGILPNAEYLVKPTGTEQQSTILLTEDNHDLREYIQAILSEAYNVFTTENGKEALDWLANNPEPDLILSDIMMPVMDGLELLETIKSSDKFRHIPMVMLTARHGMEAKLSALQLGVDDYITKPFDEQELQIRIRNLINNSSARLAFLQNEIPEEDGAPSLSQTAGVESPLNPITAVTMTVEDQKWIKEFEELVKENLTNSQFSLSSCAATFFVSERQLQRRIIKCTGLNYSNFLRLVRLQKARQILEKGEVVTVSEVAYMVGFNTPAYFSKIFFKEFGKKPTDYFLL